MISIEHYLALSLALFAIGAIGALLRRHPVIVLMSIEVMLAAANVNLIAFSRLWGTAHGQAFALFLMADAAAQTALGLGIFVACSARRRGAPQNGRSEAADEESDAQLRGVDAKASTVAAERTAL